MPTNGPKTNGLLNKEVPKKSSQWPNIAISVIKIKVTSKLSGCLVNINVSLAD